MKKRKVQKIIILKIFKPAAFILNKILKIFKVFIIWRSGKAIGDQVLIAGFAKVISRKYKNKVIVLTNYPEILSLSPWILKAISINKVLFWRLFYYLLKVSEGERIIEYNFPYRKYGFKSHLNAYQKGFYNHINNPPIWHAHVADRFAKELFKDFSGGLQKSEKKDAQIIIKKIRENYKTHKLGIINPVGKSTYTNVKKYGFSNYQKIISLTSPRIKWIQTGMVDDPKLSNLCLDLRGKSLDFLVDIISLSDLVLSDEGLLNHIAGSFPYVNSYVSYSEFSPINYYSYKNTITIGIPQNLNKNIKFWKKRKSKNLKKNDPSKLAREILDNEF